MEYETENRFLLDANESAKIERGEFIGRWVPEAYDYMGGWYIAWVFINIFIQLTIFLRSSYMFWVVRGVKVEKKSGFDIQDTCLSFNMIACILRVVHMLDPAQTGYDKPFGNLYPQVVTTILLKIPQIFWMAGIIFLVVFWRDLVISSQKLQKKADTKKIGKSVIILISVLFLVVMPLGIVQAITGSRQILMISNNFFALYILVLIAGGVLYARKLKKMCEKLKSDGGKETIMKIHRTVINLVLFAILAIGSVVWNTVDNKRIMKHIIYWYFINTIIEPFLAVSLLQAVAPRTDTASRWANKKFRSTSAGSSKAESNHQSAKTRPSTVARPSVSQGKEGKSIVESNPATRA